MPHFFYTAIDEQNHRITDQLMADDAQTARRQLEARGWQVIELELLAEAEVIETRSAPKNSLPQLDSTTARQLLTQFLELQQSESPLPNGLLVAAESAPTRRLARALRTFAQRLNDGAPPEEVFDAWASGIPPHVVGLLAAARRTGQDSDALLQLLEHEERQKDLQRRIWQTLAYPLTMLVFALVLFVAAQLFITRPMRAIVDDFGFANPGGLAMLFWWGDFGVWLILGFLTVIIALALTCRATLSDAWWHMLLSSAPMVGVLHAWSGTANCLRLLGMLFRQNIPVPEALHLVESAMADASLRKACKVVRDQVLSGISLSQAIQVSPQFSGLVASYIRGGELRKNLPEACDAAADLFESRIAIRLDVLRNVVPGLIFMLILSLLLVTISVIFLPIVLMIQSLR
jgi:type II secretory pathway component PulF